MGVYAQGVWLKEFRYDVFLLLEAPPFTAGGPNIGWFSAYSWLFAVLSSLLEPPAVFLLLHLLNFLLAALTLTVAFVFLSDEVGAVAGLAWTLALAANPVWSAQTGAIYLEIPVAAFCAFSLHAVWRRRWRRAALFAIAGGFAKTSALMFAFSLFVTFFLEWGLRKALRRDGAPSGFWWIALPFPALYGLMLSASPRLRMGTSLTEQIGSVMNKSVYLFPDLAVLLVLAVVLAAAVAWRRGRGAPALRRPETARVAAVLVLYVAGFCAGFVLFFNGLVRYFVIVLPALFLLLALLMSGRKKVSVALAAAVFLFGSANQSGALLPRLPGGIRSGDVFERSREYLVDLDANKAMCRYLEQNHFAAPIVCKYPFVQMLTVPELGYVTRPLPNVLSAGPHPAVSRASRLAAALEGGNDLTTLCIFSPNGFEYTSDPPLRPRPGEPVIYVDDALGGQNVVFRRRWTGTGGPGTM